MTFETQSGPLGAECRPCGGVALRYGTREAATVSCPAPLRAPPRAPLHLSVLPLTLVSSGFLCPAYGVRLCRHTGRFPLNPPVPAVSVLPTSVITSMLEATLRFPGAARAAVAPALHSDVWYSEGTRKLLVRLRPDGDGGCADDPPPLAAMRPSASAMLAVDQRFAEQHAGVAKSVPSIKGVIVTALDSREDSPYDFLSRYFAPWVGIDEDPVNGSSHTVLAPYWAAEGEGHCGMCGLPRNATSSREGGCSRLKKSPDVQGAAASPNHGTKDSGWRLRAGVCSARGGELELLLPVAPHGHACPTDRVGCSSGSAAGGGGGPECKPQGLTIAGAAVVVVRGQLVIPASRSTPQSDDSQQQQPPKKRRQGAPA